MTSTYSPSTEKLLRHLPALAGMTRRLAIAAGQEILEHFDESGFRGHVHFKTDQSPVTVADLRADEIIRAGLLDITPDIPVVTEETVHLVDHTALIAVPHYWLVDGLDGTEAFAKGDPDFTVNIALIDMQRPVLGVIYAPALGEGYAGVMGNDPRAVRWQDDQGDDQDTTVRPLPPKGLTLVTSTTQIQNPHVIRLVDSIKMNKHLKRHSSIKFCDIAAGRADLMVAARDIYFWDTAAGDAIVHAAGGFAVDLFGQTLLYDRTVPHFVNFGVVAGSDFDYINPIIQEFSQVT